LKIVRCDELCYNLTVQKAESKVLLKKKRKRMSKAKVAVPIKKAVPAPQIKAKAVIKKKDDDEAYTTKCGKP
jgi:hypothetical protein